MLKVNGNDVTNSPVIQLDSDVFESRANCEVAQIDVVGPTGEVARFWLSVVMKRGRPTVTMTTKPDKDLRSEVTKKLQGTFNIL